METRDRIKQIFINLLKLKPEELRDDINLVNGIGVDSTEMVEAVIALEKEFNTKLDPKEITKNSTINEIADVIQSKISAQ